MTVAENIALGLAQARATTRTTIARADRGEPGGGGAARAPRTSIPAELSGGMRKRVGIARAIALKPRYILYDEPTTGLDPVTSAVMDQLMMRTRDLGVTGLVVTHDMRSAFTRRRPDRHAVRGRASGRSAPWPRSRPPTIPWCGSSSRAAAGDPAPAGRSAVKRSNEFAVGPGGAGGARAGDRRRALAERDRRQPEEGRLPARFRTVGGLGVGRAGHAARRARSAGSRPSAWSRTSGWRPSSASTARRAAAASRR